MQRDPLAVIESLSLFGLAEITSADALSTVATDYNRLCDEGLSRDEAAWLSIEPYVNNRKSALRFFHCYEK